MMYCEMFSQCVPSLRRLETVVGRLWDIFPLLLCSSLGHWALLGISLLCLLGALSRLVLEDLPPWGMTQTVYITVDIFKTGSFPKNRLLKWLFNKTKFLRSKLVFTIGNYLECVLKIGESLFDWMRYVFKNFFLSALQRNVITQTNLSII